MLERFSRILLSVTIMVLTLHSISQYSTLQSAFVPYFSSSTSEYFDAITISEYLNTSAISEYFSSATVGDALPDSPTANNSSEPELPLQEDEDQQPKQPDSQQQSHRGSGSLVIDVMSIASQQRPDYWQAQQRTWASHPSVRHFWAVDERDDGPEWRNCSRNMTRDDVINAIVTCRNLHNTPFLQQYRMFARGFYLRKSNPAGWMCAQIRPGTALAKLGQYYVKIDELPDFAVLVDDDTLLQMNLLEEHLNRTTTPTVWAGCLNVSPLGVKEVARFSPFGGAGTVWSKEALRRLLQPIHCQQRHNNNTSSDPAMTTFVQQVCNRIQENLVLEKDLFEEGMRMFEFIQKVYYKSPNCFHSDWLLGHFIHYYYLSEPTPSQIDGAWWDSKKQGRLLPLHDPNSVGVFNNSLPQGNLCKTTQEKKPSDGSCNNETMICHYVNPDWMAKVTKQWMGNSNTTSSSAGDIR